MAEAAKHGNFPPRIKRTEGGEIDNGSLADLLEWFLNNDPKVGYIRHPFAQELFEWKQADDAAQGKTVYPFDNAEARFAVGSFQAIAENNSEHALQIWITDILNALQDARNTNKEIAESHKLEGLGERSAVEMAGALPSRLEQRLFLTSCWIEILTIAEARFLGWVYQELYGKPFQPGV